MTLDLVNYERKTLSAVKIFWESREAARLKQISSGKADQGERAGVTGGKNMDGIVSLILDIVHRNGLKNADLHRKKRVLTLPGYFRPTKQWDLIITSNRKLIAAIELKSQVGPSFGNNFNNRCEEAIGSAHDFWTAYREGAFGSQTRPFIGWMLLVEDALETRSPVDVKTPHFPTFEEFVGASYLERYDILCQRLVREQLYTSACLVASPKKARKTGQHSFLSEMTNLRTFVTTFAGHVAAEAARAL